MGYIHASGGGGRERKCRKEKKYKKIDETTEGRKNVRVRESLTGGRKHRDGVGGCREDDGFIITQALLISTVCTIGSRNLHSLFLDAHTYTHTHTHTHTHTLLDT